MSMEKIKKYVKDHKDRIIIDAWFGALGLIALGFGAYTIHGFCKMDNDWCEAVEPGALWAAFDKDGNLVDAVRGIDGNFIDPKTIMVFGDKIKK